MNAVTQLAATAAGYLADGGNSPSDVDPTTGKGPEWGEAAPIGLLVIVLLCVAVYFLVKSMNRNIKKVPASFGASEATGDEHGAPPADEATAGSTPVDEAPGDTVEGDGVQGDGAEARSAPSAGTS